MLYPQKRSVQYRHALYRGRTIPRKACTQEGRYGGRSHRTRYAKEGRCRQRAMQRTEYARERAFTEEGLLQCAEDGLQCAEEELQHKGKSAAQLASSVSRCAPAWHGMQWLANKRRCTGPAKPRSSCRCCIPAAGVLLEDTCGCMNCHLDSASGLAATRHFRFISCR